MRPGVSGLSYFGEKLATHFYHDNGDEPTTFSWDNLAKGNTLAILYAERKTFMDMSEGIREENLDSCFVFKSSIESVFREAQKLLNDADLKSDDKKLKCFGCGVETEQMFRCSSCHLAKYCSKVPYFEAE